MLAAASAHKGAEAFQRCPDLYIGVLSLGLADC